MLQMELQIAPSNIKFFTFWLQLLIYTRKITFNKYTCQLWVVLKWQENKVPKIVLGIFDITVATNMPLLNKKWQCSKNYKESPSSPRDTFWGRGIEKFSICSANL